MDAGDRFELPMHLAYETGVVTTLPAKLVESRGVEPHPPLQQDPVFKAGRGTNSPALLSIKLVPPLGIEPSSSVLQTVAMTTFAKAAKKII